MCSNQLSYVAILYPLTALNYWALSRERGALCSYQVKASTVFFNIFRKPVCSMVIWTKWANATLE
ncbi:hypothetical protein EIZ48_15230 [Photobacterium alginatilyticum]|uniref:Secreted protein n=1 Tax=Photobacterium alginatilyticum TaxID=1775171 RepID=A0ABW9YJ87_9GAMM|nr:hypothetical protein [Photobacterium alginatilyticum]